MTHDNGDGLSSMSSNEAHVPSASESASQNDPLKTSSSVNSKSKTKNFVHSTLTSLSEIWSLSLKTADQLLEDTGAYQIIDQIALHLVRHPYLAVGASAAIVALSLPFIILSVFAIGTVLATFTGFIIVEGTLITIASILLFGFLGAVILIFLFFGIVLMGGYFGFLQIYDMLRGPTPMPMQRKNVVR